MSINEKNITIEFIEKYTDNIDFKSITINEFALETKRTKNKELYWILEKIRAFNKTKNLVIISKYM